MSDSRPIIAVTTGDPGGIGPEVIVKALADPELRASGCFRVYGPVATLDAAARAVGIAPFWHTMPHSASLADSGKADVAVLDYPSPGPFERQATKIGGELSFQLVEDAISDARRAPSDERHINAVVTGPISKLAWKMAGHGEYPGHTELFAARCNAKRFAMMFVSPRLKVILATVHLPLMNLREALTTHTVVDAIELGDEACRQLGIARPRIAVCGLNPHAGEGGMLGDDESRTIEPAIRATVSRGIDARGPFPGDTIFNAAVRGDFDLVVAMYHDQGLIPVKLLDRDRAVNVTVGLPMIRTSPDHGTAFDIAGTNKADPGSMKAAIELAIQMCENRRTSA